MCQAAALWLLERPDVERDHRDWIRLRERALVEKENMERAEKADRKALLAKCANPFLKGSQIVLPQQEVHDTLC